jgi:hypothetical protein
MRRPGASGVGSAFLIGTAAARHLARFLRFDQLQGTNGQRRFSGVARSSFVVGRSLLIGLGILKN